MASEAFSGFHAGTRATAVPNTFFTLVLPEIDDAAELVVTIYLFFALGHGSGVPRVIPRSALAAELPLMRALSRMPGGAASALEEGLSRAFSRGSLVVVDRAEDGETILALNTDTARRLAAERGVLADPWRIAEDDEETAARTGQPNIYALYEENIGLLPPILLDELDEAELRYPRAWIAAAFREAIASNHRSWRYISRILERWKLEGPDYETPGGPAAVGASARRRNAGGRRRRVIE